MLLKAVGNVAEWNSGKPPIKSMYSVVDGNSGMITFKVRVEGKVDSAKLEETIKHDYLMALVENLEPNALMGFGFDKMKIKVDINK